MPSPNPLLLYDLTDLGRSHATPDQRSGIARVVDSLITPLLQTSPYPIQFTGSGECSGTQAWVRDYRPDLLSRLASRPTLKEKARWHLSNWRERNRSHPFLGLRRFQRPVEVLLNQLQGPEVSLPSALVNKAALFHSLFWPIPPEVRQNPRLAVFLTVHDLIPVLQPQYSWPELNSLFARILNSVDKSRPTDRVFCISGTVRDEFCDFTGFPPERVTVMPLAADPGLFYPSRETALTEEVRRTYELDDAPYILSLCQMNQRKNLPGLMRAFSLAVRTPPLDGCLLVLAGRLWKGNKEQLLHQARELGIEDRIRLTDFVPDEHLAPLYGGAKAFVYPTFSEGFGLPAVESMQCGTPLICSDIPVLREVAGDAALYANPHQPEEIASRLVDILNPDTASALSEKGRTRAALYSWESTAQIVVKAYTQSLRELGHI